MMRRTGLVSRRGAVVMLAVALAAAACFGGIRLVRLLQHRAAAQAAASVRASATAAVADDVDVCDIVPAGTIESATDQQIRRFWMHRFDGELTCMIYFQERIPLNFVSVTYKRGPITASIKSSWADSFEELAARDGVTPLSIEGLQGRGLLIADDRGAPSALWEYPNGHYAAVRPSVPAAASTAQDRIAATDDAIAILTRIAPRLPATAALPEILDSSYPLEADQHETTTTPNPRRTPAILTAALALTCAAAYRLALARPRVKVRTRPR